MSNTFESLLSALEKDSGLATSIAAAPIEDRAGILESAGLAVPTKDEQDAFLAENPNAFDHIHVHGDHTMICQIVK